jgi:hypothetical protein
MIEPHALVGNTIEVGCVVYSGAVATNGFCCVIIRHYEDDIRLHFCHVEIWSSVAR